MKHFSEMGKIKWDIYKVSPKHKETDNIMCFDIEVSSFFKTPDGLILSQNDIVKKFKRYQKNKRYDLMADYFSKCEKGSICYVWQFGIENKGKFETYYGRELKEFKTLLDTLNKTLKYRVICYIHNASYEHNFLLNILDIEQEEHFYTDKREPLYFRYGNIEFRCSYRLTNLSLAAWGKQTDETQKLKMDYGIIRTPKSNIENIMPYCENDILVMYDGLVKYRNIYKYTANIPYTQTGQPRREIKKLFHNNKNYHERITKQLPKTSNEYRIQKRCYGGGLTIANANNVGKHYIDKNGRKRIKIKIHYNVTNMDIASAYPKQMVLNKFPSGKFRKTTKKLSELDFDKYCYLMCVKLPPCKAVSIKHILPRAKIPVRKNCTFDNGKLVEIKKDGYAILYCTEVDYQTYKDFYNFKDKDVELVECYETTKAYLDKDFVEYILKLYADKTKLKGLDNSTPEHYKDYYDHLKQILNACYGMSCTSLIFNPVDLINGEWKDLYIDLTEEELEEKENEILEDLQKKSWKNLVAFSMGLYVTSYQRANICKSLKWIDDKDYLYTDTDSDKFLHGEKYIPLFEEENKRILKQIEEVAAERNIDINLFKPKDINGVEHPIGFWEQEETYERACFAGAKRYCFEKHGEFGVTVSGVPKCVSKHMTINDFQDGFIFDSEMCEYKKNIVTYLDGDNLVGVTLNKGKYDEFKTNEKYGINMYPTGYRMNLEKDYVEYISQLAKRRKRR